MSLAIVVPTIPRKQVGFKTFRTTLESNKHLLSHPKVVDIFIYCDSKHVTELSECFDPGNYKHIPKIVHEENKHQKGYAFWRSNLCLDFMYCLTEASKRTTATNLMWLEDDTVLLPNAVDEFMKHSHIAVTITGLGCTTVVIERSYMPTLRQKMLDNNIVNDIDLPLDWFIPKLAVKIKKRLNLHKGGISSRQDELVIRDVEN